MYMSPDMYARHVLYLMASVYKFPAVKTGCQGEFGAGSWRGSKQLQGLASKGGTEENGGNAELEH
jgi:hypothetical protein